jgi:hypothetical protein
MMTHRLALVVVMLALAACAPRVQPTPRADEPPATVHVSSDHGVQVRATAVLARWLRGD